MTIDPGPNTGNTPRLTVLPGGRHGAAMTTHTTPTWGQIIADYRQWMASGLLSPNTIDLRVYQLRRLSDSFPDPWSITTDELAGWLTGHGWAAGTIRSWRSMLGSFYRWAVITHRISESPAATLPRSPKVQLRPRPTPDGVVDEGMATARPRTALMIRLGRRVGLRRGEIAQVHTDDLTRESDGWWLLVHGKGAKLRSVPIDDGTVTAIKNWMRGRTGFLFPGAIDGHLAPATVGRLVTRHLTGHWSTHTLRHRYASACYEGCHDLAAVQELLGHSKPETTRIYVEVNRDALRRAAQWAA